MPQVEVTDADMRLCPSCGALLCDWVSEPAEGDAHAVGAALLAVWEQARDNHELYSDTGSDEGDIRFLTLGLCGEAGEVGNFVKKRWRDNEPHTEAIQKEIADVLAYAFMLAQKMGLTPSALINIVADKQLVFVAKMRTLKGSPR